MLNVCGRTTNSIAPPLSIPCFVAMFSEFKFNVSYDESFDSINSLHRQILSCSKNELEHSADKMKSL